jgi:hypothetical protein
MRKKIGRHDSDGIFYGNKCGISWEKSKLNAMSCLLDIVINSIAKT